MDAVLQATPKVAAVIELPIHSWLLLDDAAERLDERLQVALHGGVPREDAHVAADALDVLQCAAQRQHRLAQGARVVVRQDRALELLHTGK